MTSALPRAVESPGQPVVRHRVTVRGTVQGVGFRPFVQRLARELGLSGFVRLGPDGVVAEAEGTAARVAAFCRLIGTQPPPLADVRELTEESIPPTGAPGFAIAPSGTDGAGRTAIPPDTAACEECRRECADPGNRRYRHPFNACTHCGPRFTLTTGLPYDRSATSMAAFPLCPPCAREYQDPAGRRFRAQPVACPDCGPRLRLTTASRDGGGSAGPTTTGEDALAGAGALLASGAVLAVKGLGGYHLACAADDAGAVRSLRARKERGSKPFAVMCADLDAVRRIAHPTAPEEAALTDRRRPIVLLRARAGGGLAEEVCQGSPYVGAMLPYTPLHDLLLAAHRPGPGVLVMTSANRSGEPIVTDDEVARTALAGIADAWLWHDRAIVSPCEDSVVRVRPDGSQLVLRRSRGYVPRPLPLPRAVLPALAVGGDLKNTLCLGAGHDAWLSGHLGDLGSLAAEEAAQRAGDRLRALTGVAPRLLVADRHPGYRSGRRAARHAAGTSVPLRTVQHHHAHVASLMAEQGLDGATPVIGVAFDGTGYGEDTALWGGEVLLADYRGFRRLAHLGYAQLPGGDAGVRTPCRTALARLRASGIPWDPALPCVAACSPAERDLLARQLDRGVACVPTSSMGRLFDVVSSLVGLCHRAGYGAQAAVELEAAAVPAWDAGDRAAYDFPVRPVSGAAPARLDPAPALRAIAADLRSGVPVPVIAARFHRAVAAGVAEVCRLARRETGHTTVALTGGAFANRLLEEECAARLAAAGLTVLRHRHVPPGDGGLALGQLVVAAAEPGPPAPRLTR